VSRSIGFGVAMGDIAGKGVRGISGAVCVGVIGRGGAVGFQFTEEASRAIFVLRYCPNQSFMLAKILFKE
jgi:hypothetical protein